MLKLVAPTTLTYLRRPIYFRPILCHLTTFTANTYPNPDSSSSSSSSSWHKLSTSSEYLSKLSDRSEEELSPAGNRTSVPPPLSHVVSPPWKEVSQPLRAGKAPVNKPNNRSAFTKLYARRMGHSDDNSKIRHLKNEKNAKRRSLLNAVKSGEVDGEDIRVQFDVFPKSGKMTFAHRNLINLLNQSSYRRRTLVYVFLSGFIYNMLLVLRRHRIICDFRVFQGFKSQDARTQFPLAEVLLNYMDNEPVFKRIELVSTPGRRIYVTARQLQLLTKQCVQNQIYLVSTSNGILTHKEAFQKNVGGELICQII